VLRLEHLSDYRRGVVERACADAGIEAGPDADFVVGRGLQILEAMASGRAAYVYGEEGGDGWVTSERYALLEADGFSGRAEASATDFERLRRDLDAYDPAMGPSNRELALAHSARDHAQELLGIFDSLAPRRDPVDAPLRELARLVRVEAATASRADAAAAEAYEAKARARELERELAEAYERNDRLTDRVAGLEQALREAQEREEAATAAAAQKQGGVRGLLGREGKVPSTEG
jgi:chromosome segregation ATPase